MFDVGFSEILLVAAVFLICVRPQDLPTVFRQLGRWYRSFRQMYAGFMNEFDFLGDEMAEFTPPSHQKEYKQEYKK